MVGRSHLANPVPWPRGAKDTKTADGREGDRTVIRVLLVVDESPANTKVRRLLDSASDFEIIGETDDGYQAVALIGSLRPEVVFLDVQMPGLDGFGVLANLEPDQMPHIVFITAYDEYAVHAFELHALDYLLKPVGPERFEAVLARVRGQVGKSASPLALDRVEELLRHVIREPRYLERVLVSREERSFFVRLENVSRVEAAKNTLVFHSAKGPYYMRGTLGTIEDKLDPDRWVRINRSEIVQIDAIAELEPWFRGEYRVALRDGTKTVWGRRYLDRVDEVLGRKF